MATVNATILKGNQKSDGTWNVCIRVWHKDKPAYIETTLFVTEKQLDKAKKLKTDFVVKNLGEKLGRFNELLIKHKKEIDNMTAPEVRQFLLDNEIEKTEEVVEEVMFLDFCKTHIQNLKDNGRESTALTLQTAYFAMNDFLNEIDVPINRITSKFLKTFEAYLRKPRTVKRMNQGKIREVTLKGLEDRGVHNRMRDIRILFNEAKEQHNDEEMGVIIIPNNPYSKYQVVEPPESEPRDRTISEIIKIKNYEAKPGSREELGKDLFMLSFYMCGINAADLYQLENKPVKRLDYCRQKTKNRRTDKAFISVKLIPEAQELFLKYAGKLQVRYSSSINLDRAINAGLKNIGPKIGIPELGFYDARFSFATIASAICGYSDAEIGKALNHDEGKHKVTSKYIRKSWTIIDNIQRDVVNAFKSALTSSLKSS